jgi:2-oxoglutarate dehydrogenase E2 component (dihydrolipoamide succinyltransferase)
MSIEIKIPSVGESVTEALLAEWFKEDGDTVAKNEPLFVIETDKVTLEVEAEAAGRLKIIVPEGETVAIGTVVGEIDTEAAEEAAPEKEAPREETASVKKKAGEDSDAKAEAAPAKDEAEQPAPSAKEGAAAEQKKAKTASPPTDERPHAEEDRKTAALLLPPSLRRLVREKAIDLSRIEGTGPEGRITQADVVRHLEARPAETPRAPSDAVDRDAAASAGGERRVAMTPIRRRIAAHLLAAKQNTAMLTTFNEIDMSRAMALRSSYKEDFQKKHGIGLGFMSFFVKACVEALGEIPEINAYLEDREIIYHDYCHVGIAVGAPKGLVVPVLRHAERMSFAGIEQAIADYVTKIKANRLELADLEGGTFTVSNGGVYGSLLSTPILNMPQSGILGMHKIEKRPVVVDDEIVIRPMMYVALSYDHRIVDGKGAVTFLRRVKEFVENPERMLLAV